MYIGLLYAIFKLNYATLPLPEYLQLSLSFCVVSNYLSETETRLYNLINL